MRRDRCSRKRHATAQRYYVRAVDYPGSYRCLLGMPDHSRLALVREAFRLNKRDWPWVGFQSRVSAVRMTDPPERGRAYRYAMVESILHSLEKEDRITDPDPRSGRKFWDLASSM